MTYFLYDFQSDSATLDYNSQNDNFPVGNVKSKYKTFVYKATGNTSEYIDIDFAAAPAINALGLICNVTSSGTISLKAYSDAARTINTFTEAITPADVILHKLSATRTEQYWRVEFTDATVTVIEVGRLALGTYTELPAIAPRPTANTQSTGIRQRSNSGQSFGVKGVQYQVASVQWPNNITNANRVTLNTMFEDVGQYTPFFADLMSGAGLYDVLYVTFGQDNLAFSRIDAGTFTTAIDFIEEL
jgi:hypothetical protein